MTSPGGTQGGELACFPSASDPVAEAARAAGLRAVDVGDATELLAVLAEAPWRIAVVVDASSVDLDDALVACKALRSHQHLGAPVLLVVPAERVDQVADRAGLFDDFATSRAGCDELAARLRHLLATRGPSGEPSVLRRGPLTLNTATYQVTIAGRALDLTYMEYELLRFLVAHPEEVVSRELLLSRVWGYEYYGGARTVDVHVRRLRAKLGEEHAHLIQTVRGVGYRFA